MSNKIITFLLILGFSGFTHAQQHEHEEAEHEAFKRHRVAFEIGSAYVPDGFETEEGDKNLYIPKLGLEYQYRLTHKWALGVMADLELAEYLIPFGQEVLSRDKAFILTLVGIYEVIPFWAVFGGAGMEIEHHKNFGVIRLGTNYEFLLGKGWDLTPTLTYDYKEEYDSWSIVFSFGRKF